MSGSVTSVQVPVTVTSRADDVEKANDAKKKKNASNKMSSHDYIASISS